MRCEGIQKVRELAIATWLWDTLANLSLDDRVILQKALSAGQFSRVWSVEALCIAMLRASNEPRAFRP